MLWYSNFVIASEARQSRPWVSGRFVSGLLRRFTSRNDGGDLCDRDNLCDRDYLCDRDGDNPCDGDWIAAVVPPSQ